MMSFFVAEVVLHALSYMSSHAYREARPRPAAARRLRHIVVTAPITMPDGPRQILRQRVESAIDLVWQSYGWSRAGRVGEDAPSDTLSPRRPEVRLGFDESTATQIVYLYDVIAHRYRGLPADFFNLMGKARAEHGPHPTLRVASLDIGAGSAALTIVTYAASNDGAIAPALTVAEVCPIGGDRLIEAVVARFILPAVERALERAGIAEPEAFLSDFLDQGAGRAVGSDRAEAGFRRRLMSGVAFPIARAILTGYDALGPDTDSDQYLTRIGELTPASSDINEAVMAAFEGLAREAGADGFRLANVEIELARSEISAAVCDVLRPLITTVSPVIRSFDCDFMLLSGWATRLGDLMGLLLDHLPLRPDRIVPIHRHRVGDWYPFRGPSGRIDDPKPVVVMGAMLTGLGVGPMSPPLDKIERRSDTHYLADLAGSLAAGIERVAVGPREGDAAMGHDRAPSDLAPDVAAIGIEKPERRALAEAP
jgi:hypothetical protein